LGKFFQNFDHRSSPIEYLKYDKKEKQRESQKHTHATGCFPWTSNEEPAAATTHDLSTRGLAGQEVKPVQETQQDCAQKRVV
jgi:hypothetical protein